MTTTAERLDTLIGENCVPMPNGWTQMSPDATQHVVETIAAEIDNLTARLGAQVDLTIETEKQLGIVRATRDAYLRDLGMLRAERDKLADRLARTDVGPRPTDERIAIAVELIARHLRGE